VCVCVCVWARVWMSSQCQYCVVRFNSIVFFYTCLREGEYVHKSVCENGDLRGWSRLRIWVIQQQQLGVGGEGNYMCLYLAGVRVGVRVVSVVVTFIG
jgi:hypothetical protein